MGDEGTVSRFCDILPALRRVAAEDPGEAAELESAVDAVRDRRADPGELADLAIRLGHPIGGRRTYAPLPGLAGGGGGILRYRCPGATCPRNEDPSGLRSAPHCHVWDTDLERVRY